MSGLLAIGAGKFAVELARYAREAGLGPVERYLVLPDEEAHAPAGLRVPFDGYRPEPGTRVLLATADPVRRRELIDGFVDAHALVAESVVHPTSVVDPAALTGPGTVVGPFCHVGAGVVLGAHTVVHNHCSIGNHSTVGANNFLAPNFHCGNSVTVGDDNFFGLSCTVAPGVTVGSASRFQAGLVLFEDAPSRHSYLTANRVKALPLP
ncbi:DapH/DapD/GlmU-related protein [Kitasatospora sp. NPDC004272]